MRRKLFIAIDPPDEVRERLSSLRTDLPARWTPKENIHMTLLFIGHANDDQVNIIKDTLKEVIEGIGRFDLEVNGLSYAPPGASPPKMVWATIADSEPLGRLRKKVCEAIGTETDEFVPHITLARISSWKLRQLDEDEVPDLPETDLSFEVDSVSLMESKTFRGSAKYELIERFELK